MPRPQRDRPKNYKSYNYAFGEENVEEDIPESTLRSQRKRKRDDSSSSSSTNDNSQEESSDDGSNHLSQGESDRDQQNASSEEDHDNFNNESNESTNDNSQEESSDDGSNHLSQGESDTGQQNASSEEDHDNFNNESNESSNDITQEASSDDGSNHLSQGESDRGQQNASSEEDHDNFNNESNESTNDNSQEESSDDGSNHLSQGESDTSQQNASSEEDHDNFNNESNESDRGDSLNSSGSDFLEQGEQFNLQERGLENDDENSDQNSQTNGSEHSEEGGGHSDSDHSNEHHEEQQQQDYGGAQQIDPFRKLKAKLQDEFSIPLNLTVTSCVGEILTNALTLVKKHNWNHTETEDLMKFTNSLLNSKAVPDSRYLLDTYFYSKEGMKYHFFCSKCSHLLLTASAASHSVMEIVCQKCSHLNCLSDLRKATFFVTFDLRYQLNLLLDDPAVRNKIVNPIDFISEPANGVMTDLYHGSSYRSFANYVNSLSDHETKFISFSLSVDSASICTGFSGQSICPCFIMLNELPPVMRMKNLLIGGLWFGVTKEKLDLFLPPIVQHITELSIPGFSLQFKEDVVWNLKAFLIDCVADSVARCDVQGIHAHRGDFPCSWCLIEGEEYMGARIFRHEPTLPPARTIEELLQDSRQAARERRFVQGVKYFSPLAAAPMFHPVEGFVVDQMHAKDEGTTKSFLNAWLGEDGKTPYYLGQPNIRKVNSLLSGLKVPRELRKGVRTLKHLPYFTGRELENWALFFSLAVLAGTLRPRFLKHWALYVQGIYLLLIAGVHMDAVQIGEDLLEEFCSKTEGLYGAHMMRFNLHLLRHLAQNCRRWGPIFALSAYAFERGIQILKKLIHDCNGIPNQICRGISQEHALFVLKDSCDSDATRDFAESIQPKSHITKSQLVGEIELLGFSKPFQASDEEKWIFNRMEVNVEDCAEFSLLLKDGCHYGPGPTGRPSNNDNSYARLKDTSIVRISKIVHNERTNAIWVVAHRVRCSPSPYVPMAVVRYDCSLCCQYIVNSIDEDVNVYGVGELSTVCVNLPLEHGHYISPMPNILNMY